ncbi:hypothetical protein EOD41_16135 [Mucilaginibacter limnophilus]|uniref:Capsule assembly Wzi family protein n=1 Tax=Mucilaginibacter limnophilus TaxID=1932778 RepID=A0A3S2UK26_9SPHI|nr:hypothetical protein [Mucilaginibacter limnophilus]RVT98325.1 hypothetical protein EOD41_16135 [Mucilaginibacter limnophilus]
MKKLFFILLVISNARAFAQHEHHMQADITQKPVPMRHDTTMKGMDHSKMNMDSMRHNMQGMNHSYSLSLPMNRNGSGTSWMPDNTPMYMLMKHTKNGMWMFHGSVFLRYNNQQLNGKTSRSDTQFDAPNWFMAMYNHKVGKNGLLNFSAMISADPLTVTERGYPLLFQSGESYKGQTLVDRQHPHDFFSGLTIGYTQRLSNKVDVFGYFGYPGEPALGPPAFMHRIIALNDPDAVLGHHWQDATHITYGVATLGVRLDKVKLEGSTFTGREPDEDRYDFDKMRFDSYSWRLSYNPDRAWAFQVSQGYIKSPELLHPHEDVWRYTASAIYASPVDNEGRYFTGSAIWGLNHSGHGDEHSFLLEGTRQLNKQAVYGRYEFVQKSAEELALEEQFGNVLFNVHKFTLGTNRRPFKTGPIEYIGGIQASINLLSQKLHPLYGSNPMSGQVYIQIRPTLHK